MTEPYETKRTWSEWAAQQEEALDEWGFDWPWWVDRVMQQDIAEIRKEE